MYEGREFALQMQELGFLGVEASDIGAEGGEFFDDALVAAVDVIDAIDDGFTGSDKSREDETSAGAEVGGLDDGAGEGRGATNDGAAAVDGDMRTHAHHFAGVEETVLKNSFGDDGGSVGLRGEGHVLGLHVGGEAGVFLGGDVGGDEFVAVVNADGGMVTNVDGNADGLQLGDDGAEVGGIAVGDGDVAIGDGSSDEERASLDAIGNDGVGGAVELFDAVNLQSGGVVAFDVRAHFAEEMDEVGNFRFASGVLENGGAFSERGSHQKVFSTGNGDFFEHDVGSLEAPVIGNFGLNIAVFRGDGGAHFFQGREMQIDGTRTDGAAAGKRDVGLTGTRDSGAESEDGSAHGFDEFVGRHSVGEGFGFDGEGGGRKGRRGDMGRHEGEKLAHGDDVANLRDIVEGDRFACEEGGGHQRESRVFRAADFDSAVKRLATSNAEFIHFVASPVIPRERGGGCRRLRGELCGPVPLKNRV